MVDMLLDCVGCLTERDSKCVRSCELRCLGESEYAGLDVLHKNSPNVSTHAFR